MDTHRMIEFVSKLNKMTQEGKLKWRVVNAPQPPLNALTTARLSTYFGAYASTFKTMTLRIYQSGLLLNALSASIYASSYQKITLEILSRTSDSILLTIDDIQGLLDLYKSIEFQACGLDDFINDILADN